MHEDGVGADRHVVQEQPTVRAADVDPPLDPVEGGEGGDRIGPVEPEVTREVIARPERHADERNTALERHVRDGGEAAVAAGRAEDVRLRLTRQVGAVLAGAEHARLDPAHGRRGAELVDADPVAGARIHEEPAAHR